MRGHGKTAVEAENLPEEGGLLGHCADKDGPVKLIADIDSVISMIHTEQPNAKVFQLGHSWGSILTQLYIEKHSNHIDGALLSGTMGPAGFYYTVFGSRFLKIMSVIRGPRRRSKFIQFLGQGSFNKPFKPIQTRADWCSRDPAEVRKYINDPYCQHIATISFYRDMTIILGQVCKDEEMRCIRSDLPVYLFSGNKDPVGQMGRGPEQLVKRYQESGVKDIELVLYPGARHELFHETNKEEAITNLIHWLDRHTSGS
jgi:alpha-beta hydrolase superfamily lysophospholipase